MRKVTFTIIILLLSVASFAQQAIWEGQEIISPEIHPNKTVTFRLFAPNAKQVQLVGDFLPPTKITTPLGEQESPDVKQLIKSDNGLWEYTTDELDSELYSYNFIVDELKIVDPNNVYFIRDVAFLFSIFLVEGNHADLYKVNSIPHGTICKRWYESPTLGIERRMTVYTPAGYETSDKDYPVFYLLHGMGGDEEAWMTLGRASQILDNLIAQGKAKPMIVVMTNGNAIQEAAPGESSLGFHRVDFRLPKTMEGSMESSFPDVVCFIDENYRTIQNKSGRAIAGLSMGGYHSLHISKEYPDMFDYVGLFSAAIMPNKDNKSPVYEGFDEKLKIQFSKNPKLYWISIGKTDFLYSANVDYRAILDKNQYKYTYRESEGGHIWRNWRIYLSEFASQLFN